MNLRNIRYARFHAGLGRHILGLLYRPGKPCRVCFGPLRGLRLQYDRSINFHAILGLWETEVFDVLHRVFVRSSLLAKDCTVADVGSNIGYYSMWFSKVAATAGHVYAFEPNPEVARFLRRNMELNGVDNVELVDSACGDHVGTTEFFLASHHHCSSLHADWAGVKEGEARTITVPMTTLDAFFCSIRANSPG